MSATHRTGFFKSALKAYLASRERQAERYVNGALLMLDDRTLELGGYKRGDLRMRPSAWYI